MPETEGNDNLNRSAQQTASAISILGQNILNNSTSLSDWSKAVTASTGALSGMLGGLGGLGTSLGRLTNFAGSAGAAIMDMTQLAGANFQSLARSGFVFENGLTGATEAALASGIALKDFGKFVESNSRGLRLFANGTGLAGDSLAEFSRASASFRTDSNNYAEGLRRLGFSNEEINESLVNFASLNRLAYLQNQQSDAQRNAAAFKFALEMDRMAQLTGQSRKELQKKMEEDRRNGRVQAFLRGLNADQQKAFLEGQQAAAAAGPMAKKAFEDMMMQGELSGQSAMAGAIYGQEFLDMLRTQRAQFQSINSEGDVENFRQGMANIQGIALRELSDERNRSVAVLGAQGEYIQALQNEFGGQTDLYDQTLTLMQQGMTEQEARLEVFRQSLRRVTTDQGVTPGAPGSVTTDGGDQFTRAFATLTTSIDQVNLAINTQLITALNSDGIQSAMGSAANGIRNATGDPNNPQPGTVLGSIQGMATGISAVWEEAFSGLGQGGPNAPSSPSSTASQSGAAADAEQRSETGETTGTPAAVPRFFGGMMQRGIPTLVGDGPNGQVLPTSEVITPNMNSLVVTMKQMAMKTRETLGPQMQQMAEQMRPQMEQMAAQMRPQMEQMVAQMRPQMEQMSPQIDSVMQDLNRKFDRLIDAYRENTRAVNLQGRNTFRV